LEAWAKIFAATITNLACASIRPTVARYFTSQYDNFMQTAGTKDGAPHYANILNLFYHHLQPDKDPTAVVSLTWPNLSTICRALTLDVFSGKATRD